MRFLSLPDIFSLPEVVLRRLVELPMEVVQQLIVGQRQLENTPLTASLFAPFPRRRITEVNARALRRRRLRLDYQRRHAGEYYEPRHTRLPRGFLVSNLFHNPYLTGITT